MKGSLFLSLRVGADKRDWALKSDRNVCTGYIFVKILSPPKKEARGGLQKGPGGGGRGRGRTGGGGSMRVWKASEALRTCTEGYKSMPWLGFRAVRGPLPFFKSRFAGPPRERKCSQN